MCVCNPAIRTPWCKNCVKHTPQTKNNIDEAIEKLEYIQGLSLCEDYRDFPTINTTVVEIIGLIKSYAKNRN